MKNSDAKLIQRVLSGDDTAFSTLVQKYQKPVHALVWRKIGDFHIAEDLTQDTFLKAYQKLATLKDPQSFAGWLYVIATNHCKTWLRKKRLQTQPLETTSSAELERTTYSEYVIDKNEQTAAEGHREVVRQLLAKLQESERTVITLYYLGEMTYEEISKFLGVSVSTIKNRLYRARRHLKKEEPLIREVLENFQITPNLTANIMHEISRIKPIVPSNGKPLVPWAAAASTVVAMLLMLGIGNQQYAIRFQQPYSLDAASEMTVELIETPLVLHRVSKPDTRTQIQSTNASGRSNTSKQLADNTSALLAEAHADETIVDYTKWKLPKEAKVRLGKGDIKRIRFSPDGNELAVASSIGIWMYSVATGDELTLLTGHTAEIQNIAFSPDGRMLASAGNDSTLRLWDTESGQQLAVLSNRGIAPWSIAFSPDSTTIASGRRVIQVWDVDTGDPIATLTGHTESIGALAFSPDGKILASASWDMSIKLWDLATEEQLSTHAGQTFVFSPDGKTLAGVTDNTNNIGLWDMQTGTQRATLVGHTWFVETTTFSSDSGLLASGDRTGAIYVWDTESGHRKKTLKGHQVSVKALAFSPDSSTLASANHQRLRLWNVNTGTLRTDLIEYEDLGQAETIALAFSPDGEMLASVGRSKVLLWDVDAHSLLSELVRRGPRINTLVFSPDSAMLLIGCGDGTIEMWNTDTYSLTSTLKPHTERIEALKFSPDGRTLASGSWDSTILLWHWASLAAK